MSRSAANPMGTDNDHLTRNVLRGRGIAFQDTPDPYYEGIEARVPGHDEPLEELRRHRILFESKELDQMRRGVI